MRKKGLFKVILVTALVLILGVGTLGAVAYWSNALDSNTTVHTGNLNVVFRGPCFVSSYSPWVHPLGIVQKSPDEKTLTSEVANLYPGSEFKIRATVKNIGTIPAKLKNVTVDIVGSPELQPYLTATVTGFNMGGILNPGPYLANFTDGDITIKLASSAPDVTEGKTAVVKAVLNWVQFNEP